MKIWPKIEQRTEQWFRARAGRPTASNFSRIITASGKDSSGWDDYALELCAQCIRPDEIETDGWGGNRHTDRGNELEPEARNEFSRIMGRRVAEVGFVVRADEVVGCSPDGLVMQDGYEDGQDIARSAVAGLEIKCLLPKIHAKYLVEGVLPDDYKQQVHGSMAVTGLRFWYFMAYCPRLAPLIIRVERDDYTEKVVDALDRFLIYYAARRKEVMPILTGKEAA